MQQLSPAGQQTIDGIAKRHGYSMEAVLSMLQSVAKGNGRMAQFNHPEFGGAGQWMSGGMTTVSDMFNNNLKASVNGLCTELSQLVAAQPDLFKNGSFQSQQQGGQEQHSYSGVNTGGASASVPPAPSHANHWWGADLRSPSSTGAQNGIRYAHFAQARRLAIEVNGKVTIYDTLDHQIGGFSQQQSTGGSIRFNSQHGLVDVARLPIVSADGVPQTGANPDDVPAAEPSHAPPQPETMRNAAGLDVFAMIDKLAELHARNVLSDAEFNAKKTELLARL